MCRLIIISFFTLLFNSSAFGQDIDFRVGYELMTYDSFKPKGLKLGIEFPNQIIVEGSLLRDKRSPQLKPSDYFGITPPDDKINLRKLQIGKGFNIAKSNRIRTVISIGMHQISKSYTDNYRIEQQLETSGPGFLGTVLGLLLGVDLSSGNSESTYRDNYVYDNKSVSSNGLHSEAKLEFMLNEHIRLDIGANVMLNKVKNSVGLSTNLFLQF